VIRIAAFLGLFLSFNCFFHHVHYYLLKIIQGDKLRSNPISLVIVVVLRKEKQLFFSNEARLNVFGHISESVIDGDIKITESQKICIFANSDITAINTLYQFKDFLFFLVFVHFVQHLFGHKAA